MRPKTGILRPAQERYLRALLSPRDRLLTELEIADEPQSGRRRAPEVVRFFEIVAATTRPQRLLDLGAGLGDGTLALARGAPQAAIVAVEEDEQVAARARELLVRGLVAERVELRVDAPLEILDKLEGPFEIIAIDGSRADARRLLDLTLPLLAVRGVVLVDRLLAGGRLAEPSVEDLDSPTRSALERFNPYFMIHPQLRALLLPIGDGLGVASKSRPLVTELGGPF